MELTEFLKSFSALVFVLSLIWLITLLLRRYGPEKIDFMLKKQPGERRLHIVESLPLDPKHKLILIKRDDAEHLIMLGAENDVVIETNIIKKATKKKS